MKRPNQYTIIAIALLYSGGAWAQLAPQDLPASADAGRLDSIRSERPDFDAQTPIPALISKPPELSAELAKRTFKLKTLKLTGAHAFEDSALRTLYSESLSKRITVGELFDIVASIQQLYLDHNYTLTKVTLPKQSLDNGHITIRVIEGYVSEVEIDPVLGSNSVIDDFRARVMRMRPLDTRELERLMLILNDLPGLKASSVLSPIEKEDAEPGAVRLTLQAGESASRVTGYASADNHGSNFTGPMQMSLGTHITGITTPYSDIFVAGTITSSKRELRQGSITHTMPLFGVSGTEWSMSASSAGTHPGDTLTPLDIEGASLTFGSELRYPLIRQREQTLSLGAKFDYKNIKTDILNSLLYDDKIRSTGADVRYQFSDVYDGTSIAQLGFTKGLDIMGARKTGSRDLSRQDGTSDFLKWNGSLMRLQSLPYNFQLFAAISGQYTNDPLLSSEEFGFGGAYVGRGYDPSEITGDRGFSASAELQYNALVPEWELALQPFAFYDAGKVWNIDPSGRSDRSATSAGGGVRFNLGGVWTLDTVASVPLTKQADNPPSYGHALGPRYLFKVSRSF